jgi:hypothetical protein
VSVREDVEESDDQRRKRGEGRKGFRLADHTSDADVGSEVVAHKHQASDAARRSGRPLRRVEACMAVAVRAQKLASSMWTERKPVVGDKCQKQERFSMELMRPSFGSPRTPAFALLDSTLIGSFHFDP